MRTLRLEQSLHSAGGTTVRAESHRKSGTEHTQPCALTRRLSSVTGLDVHPAGARQAQATGNSFRGLNSPAPLTTP